MNSRSARNTAMDLLARRDHSHRQLRDKLLKRDFTADEIDDALQGLRRDGLLDEERFAESYIHQRAAKGFGPLRIRHELKEQGIHGDLVGRLMEAYADGWVESMQRQRQKRFGLELPEDARERMKQARFLQNRGFSPESVMRLFRR
jgi:regulatory protein